MKRSLNKKLIIILSIIAVIIITCVVLFFTTDIFRTKRGAFFRYFNNTADALEVLEMKELADYRNAKLEKTYIRNATVTIQDSSNIANSNILDKIRLNFVSKVDNKNEKANADVTISRDNTRLETISAVKNKDIFGIYCGDVSSGFISVRNEKLKKVAENMGLSTATIIPNEINNIGFDKIIETSKIEKKHIQECLDLIRNDVPNTAYNKEGKKRIKINDNSYTTNAYSLSLDNSASANLQISLLEKISKDSILMDYLTSKAKLMGMDEEYTSINSLNSIMKKKIEELKINPKATSNLIITVFEYKQKNARTEIKSGDFTIQIDHLKENNEETSSVKINNTLYKIQHNESGYTFTYKEDGDNGRIIKIDYNQQGSLENNDIKNYATIHVDSGIKKITYAYSDSVNFTDDIGNIKDFEDKTVAILNDYSNQDVKEFIKNLKQKINSVYTSKGASIGINLDPIFEIE